VLVPKQLNMSFSPLSARGALARPLAPGPPAPGAVASPNQSATSSERSAARAAAAEEEEERVRRSACE